MPPPALTQIVPVSQQIASQQTRKLLQGVLFPATAHLPLLHVRQVPQAAQARPPAPQATSAVPGRQAPLASQQPAQVAGPHGGGVVAVVVVVVVVVGAAVLVVVVVVVVGGCAVQRRASPGPPSAQTSPAQQIWFPSQGCPSPRQAGSAAIAFAPPSAASRPPPSPRRTRRREAPAIASRFASVSKRSPSIALLPLGVSG